MMPAGGHSSHRTGTFGSARFPAAPPTAKNMVITTKPLYRKDEMEYTITGHDRVTCTDFTRTFWIQPGGGYVRELEPGKPGILASQVCIGLAHTGLTLSATEDTLRSIIKRERARERRQQTSSSYACGCSNAKSFGRPTKAERGEGISPVSQGRFLRDRSWPWERD